MASTENYVALNNKIQMISSMGMIGNYLRVSKKELEEYIDDSSKLEGRVYGDENFTDKNLMDIDKAWEGIFFILTGKSLATSDQDSSPLCWVLAGPLLIDEDLDMGYGPASFTTIEQTLEVSSELNKISTEEFKSKYNGKLMAELEIYPTIWDESDAVEYLLDNFVKLKKFYNKATTDKQAIILFIN